MTNAFSLGLVLSFIVCFSGCETAAPLVYATEKVDPVVSDFSVEDVFASLNEQERKRLIEKAALVFSGDIQRSSWVDTCTDFDGRSFALKLRPSTVGYSGFRSASGRLRLVDCALSNASLTYFPADPADPEDEDIYMGAAAMTYVWEDKTGTLVVGFDQEQSRGRIAAGLSAKESVRQDMIEFLEACEVLGIEVKND